ncbi:MAG: hypothetical protein ACYCY2_06485 [Acidithiobacillus ferriphilus]
MTAFIFANNVNTTLGAAASSSATTLTLASSANLPTLGTGQQMPMTLNDAATGLVYEIVYVTAISGATLTVIRAREGTTAQNWSVGDYAACMHTAQSTAAMNGNALQPFEVADAVDGSGAVNLSQVASVAPMYSQHIFTPASGDTYTQKVSFTAPSNGFIVGIATQNNSSDPQPVGIEQTLSINGTNYGSDKTVVSKSNYGVASVSAGTSCTVTNTLVAGTSTGTFQNLSQTVVAIFIPNP